jgi:hypothetical protein
MQTYIEREREMYMTFISLLDMEKKMVSQFHILIFFSLSVTGKSGKGPEMQHQEVKPQSLP